MTASASQFGSVFSTPALGASSPSPGGATSQAAAPTPVAGGHAGGTPSSSTGSIPSSSVVAGSKAP